MNKTKKSLLKNTKIAYLSAVVCTFMWGLAIPMLQRGYDVMGIDATGDTGSQLIYAGVRFVIASVLVYIVMVFSQKKLVVPQKTSILPYISLGLVQTMAQYIFYYIGIGKTYGANTALITSCISFFTVLLAPIFFKSDKLTLPKIGGSIIGFLGVIVVTGTFEFSISGLVGDILVLLSTLCAASGNIISKKIADGKNPMEITSFQLLFGGVALIILGVLFGGSLSFNSIESVVYLLILSSISAIAFSLWSTLLKHHPASRISVFNLLVPVFGTILSGIILGENIFRPETAIALILIVTGIILVNVTFNKKGQKE